jgi:hypothetical protein
MYYCNKLEINLRVYIYCTEDVLYELTNSMEHSPS